ncbi:MAG: cation-transporting P-type ATPase [Verrucomicrobia bacterium]|nr:cation-transporting P-type ATPase [Verrucomicrobiota bacterium]
MKTEDSTATMRSQSTSWHHLDAPEVVRLLGTDLNAGLTTAEVTRRLAKFGQNIITPRSGTPAWVNFLRQFHAPLVYILLAATGVTAFFGEWVDSSVILGVVVINAIVGFIQEGKAERAIGSLSRMITTEAAVRRDGREQRIHSTQLVPGDVVLLRPGDRVPADLRLFRVKGVHVDESALTGESVPVHKHADSLALDTVLADRKNLAFTGTHVTGGQADGIVWATGDATETGHIARLIAEAPDLSTPLTRKITQFSGLLLWVILALALATFAVGVARGEKVVAMFMSAVALAVGAIPEGLPAAVTIVLAIGVSRMAKRRAIIRKLPAVETLGSTTVICSDKTGTLTKNQMTVREIFAGGRLHEVTGSGYESKGEVFPAADTNRALLECLRAGVLCNDAQLVRDAEGRLAVQGDPTEAALIVAAEKAGMLKVHEHRDAPVLDAIPFESGHMFRATLNDARTARLIYKVGAAERLLERCSDALDEQGNLVPFDMESAHRITAEMAARGLRVLAFARRHMPADHERLDHRDVSGGMTFLGLQGMIDPPRPEAIAAVRNCQDAGIAVKMITGDHPVTASTIARQIGLYARDQNDGGTPLSGRDLDAIPDADLPDAAERTAVFARVAPEQKLRLVRALQSRGHIVAMTGDGVNDAPALKQADIGVAMGISGTDVAKGAAAMVLLDDNFASIEAAVEEGRGVFDNITKFIVWILPTNLGEALLLITAIFLGLPLPVLPLQLLWINLTDTLLGLPLAFEPKESGLMRRPPRIPGQPLLTRTLMMRTTLVSLVMLAGGLGLFFWELNIEHAGLPAARTAVVNVIVLIEAVYLFNCRSLTHPVFTHGLFKNPWAVAGSLGMLAAQLLFTHAPIMNRLFHSAPISGACWLRITAIVAVLFVLVEVEKWLRFGRHRDVREIPG